jgi:hypothetical protein
MSSIKLTDGIIIHIYVEHRVMHQSYGLYVVGHGMCIPVDDSEEAQELLDKLKSK